MTAADRKRMRAQLKIVRTLIKRMRKHANAYSKIFGQFGDIRLPFQDLDALLRWTEELCQALEAKT